MLGTKSELYLTAGIKSIPNCVIRMWQRDANEENKQVKKKNKVLVKS